MKPNNRTRVTRALSLSILLSPHQASISFTTADTMAPAKVLLSSSLLVLSLVGLSVDGFLGPLPLASERIAAARRAAVAPRSLSSRLESQPQHTREAWRRQASMMTVQRDERPPPFGKNGKELVHKEPRWRLSNISRRVRKVIRKAIMGYLPEEEISYKESVAMAAAASEALRRETQIVDEGLVDDSIKAKNAARGLVGARQGDDDNILGDDFVHLDVGDKSPMEAEETMAALRKKLEKGIPPDTDAERLFRQQQQQRRERSSRPPSFDGDTAVAELPSPKAGMDQPKEGTTGSTASPKLASREDIERLERLFHSAGREPLR